VSDSYRLFGVELSPYSVKVRSYLRLRALPHEWVIRGPANQEEFARRARLPLIPLLITPDDRALQDSTPILEALDAADPQRRLQPKDPLRAFCSALLEEYGDEWGNKWMFHYRWWYEPDREAAARRIALAGEPDLDPDTLARRTRQLGERMHARLPLVGSSGTTRARLECSFREAVDLLEAHLSVHPFLLGGAPVLADFGIWPQLYQCWTDPTAGGILRERAPALCRYAERMLDPREQGELEPWSALAATLEPLLEREVAGRFLPWSDANARAVATDAPELRVVLDGETFVQAPQKYAARSLAALRARYAALGEVRDLDAVLERTGCLRWLCADA
jgi:glutathione S-transferase